MTSPAARATAPVTTTSGSACGPRSASRPRHSPSTFTSPPRRSDAVAGVDALTICQAVDGRISSRARRRRRATAAFHVVEVQHRPPPAGVSRVRSARSDGYVSAAAARSPPRSRTSARRARPNRRRWLDARFNIVRRRYAPGSSRSLNAPRRNTAINASCTRSSGATSAGATTADGTPDGEPPAAPDRSLGPSHTPAMSPTMSKTPHRRRSRRPHLPHMSVPSGATGAVWTAVRRCWRRGASVRCRLVPGVRRCWP